METFIIIVIVGLAAAYLINNTVKGSKKEDRCDNGCAACTSALTCDEEADPKK
jgi:uncharacterized membrane protein YuzA (DUF378 family)